jgi:hypothetical protein
MEELPETQWSALERAKGILSLCSYTKEEIDKILTIPWMADFLVNSISWLVGLALSASALWPSIIDKEKPSEKPTPTVQVSSIIPPQQPKIKFIKVSKRETPVFLDNDALESMKTEIGVFLDSEIQKILANCPKYKPWQQIITQAITQWNKFNPIQSLYKYDSLCWGLKNPWGQWRSQYGIHNVEDACHVFWISLSQNMITGKKSNKTPISHIPDWAQDRAHPATSPNIPDNKIPFPDTPWESVVTRYLWTWEPWSKWWVQSPRAKWWVQSPLSKLGTRSPRIRSTSISQKPTESIPTFEVKDLQDLLKNMNELLSTVYANINRKDPNIQAKWQGIGDIGTFAWEKKSLKWKPTIIIRFEEAQKQQRVESKKIWARLATKTFTEHLLKSGWKFSDGLNTAGYWRHYMFKYGNFQIQFYLPFGVEGLKETPKEEKIWWWIDIPIDMNTIWENELWVVKSLLFIYLQKIYDDHSWEYSATRDFEIGQNKEWISHKREEFVFNTWKTSYEIDKKIKDKKIIIYPSAFSSPDTVKVLKIMEFLKKRELLEKFLENNWFRKDNDGNWIDDVSKKFIFRQNGSNPILEFQIDEWIIEIHTSNRETQYKGKDKRY